MTVFDPDALPYDYQGLAGDLYREGFELLDKLVDMRKSRGMTQKDLAREMNVSQAYISQIENGQRELVSLLTDYALEVGAHLEYKVVPAEQTNPKEKSGRGIRSLPKDAKSGSLKMDLASADEPIGLPISA
ncbi:helix-turn-helix transcriptional regulator [Bifidobacterium sp. ESL0790]|uniref:helix-turn-helix domain-containing protein n=1 Tax=Bifidobacterium sp. ESL0790 TaxID=2983233 RepID=UPI0023F83DD2|nr:helix-turn-helix transcriptional regulator [Bifidobacterium sp. ESL0790]WEV72208.1 helix-turn-helix transcriptional regulator [Bifidobacterium sp. ESL0790]